MHKCEHAIGRHAQDAEGVYMLVNLQKQHLAFKKKKKAFIGIAQHVNVYYESIILPLRFFLCNSCQLLS